MEGLEFDHINTPEGSSISILRARNLCYVSVFIPTTLSQTLFFLAIPFQCEQSSRYGVPFLLKREYSGGAYMIAGIIFIWRSI